MRPKSTMGVLTVEDVLSAALRTRCAVRLYVPESPRLRVIEGVPASLTSGRDGRARVIIAVEAETELVEIRVLVDRVVRAESLDASGAPIPERSVGPMPEHGPGDTTLHARLDPDPLHSGRKLTRRDPSRRSSSKQAANRAVAVPGKPGVAPTEPMHSGPLGAGRHRGSERPTEPAIPASRLPRKRGSSSQTQPEIRKPSVR